MSGSVKRGFNRLSLVLTIAWAIFWAVLYPLQRQWEGAGDALTQYYKDNKNCEQLFVEHPKEREDCWDDATSKEKNSLEFYSLKDFWVYPVAFWRLFVPLIVLPPVAVYGLAVLSVWIWRGFKPRPSGTDQRLP